jgi:hypothetical protein
MYLLELTNVFLFLLGCYGNFVAMEIFYLRIKSLEQLYIGITNGEAAIGCKTTCGFLCVPSLFLRFEALIYISIP